MMSGPEGSGSKVSNGRGTGAFRKERIFLLAGIGVLLVVLAVLIGILRRDIAWQLNLTAQTEIIDIELAGRTQWNIGHAVVCERRSRRAGGALDAGDSVCGSPAWQALAQSNASDRRWLELLADEKDPVSVRLSTEPSGAVHMSLRRKAGSLGVIRSHQEASASRTLPSAINIAWTPSPADAARRDTIVLPFTGRTTVGHDVAWSVEKMLRSGQLAVFAASEDALAGRTLAEESTLILGDQVVMGGVEARDGVAMWPKGFVSFASGRPDAGDWKVMDVVMFAPAQGVDIERYGGGKYSFQASWWVKIKHQSAVVIAAVLLTGFLSLISSLLSILQALPDVKRWYRVHAGDVQGGNQSREA